MTDRRSRHRNFLRSFFLCGNNSGQALVELALVVPILTLLLLGAVELGRIAYAVIEVSGAAEAAVRYGAQNGATSIDTTGMQLAAQDDAPNIALSWSSNSTTLTCGCANADGTATPIACGSTSSCTMPVNTLTVVTSTTFDPLIHLPGLPKTFTLHGYANQKVLNQ